MHTKLLPLKQFQNCHKKFSGTMEKCEDPQNTAQMVEERLSSLNPGQKALWTQRENIIPGAGSVNCTFDRLSASGKGLSPQQARASGLMELTERYSWLHFDYEKAPGYRFCSYNDLPQKDFLSPDYFLANLQNPDSYSDQLPAILDTPQKWVTAWDLADGTEAFYPLTWHSMTYTSNGLAAGNCLTEALLQGICEVVERENICRLFMDKRPGRLVDTTTLDPELSGLLEQCQSTGIEISILDISSDLGIPTFCVIGQIPSAADTFLELGVGQGCHINPHWALVRALSEYLESLAIQKENYRKAGSLMDQSLKYIPALHSGFLPTYNREMLTENAGTISFRDYPVTGNENLEEDLACLVNRLTDRGFRPFYIDETHPLLQIPVVRLFIPKMRSMLSGAIYTPKQAQAQIAFEAGRFEEAYEYYLQYIDEDPLQQQAYSSPFTRMSLAGARTNPGRIISTDYREYYIKSIRLKNQANRLLQTFKPLLEN